MATIFNSEKANTERRLQKAAGAVRTAQKRAGYSTPKFWKSGTVRGYGEWDCAGVKVTAGFDWNKAGYNSQCAQKCAERGADYEWSYADRLVIEGVCRWGYKGETHREAFAAAVRFATESLGMVVVKSDSKRSYAELTFAD